MGTHGKTKKKKSAGCVMGLYTLHSIAITQQIAYQPYSTQFEGQQLFLCKKTKKKNNLYYTTTKTLFKVATKSLVSTGVFIIYKSFWTNQDYIQHSQKIFLYTCNTVPVKKEKVCYTHAAMTIEIAQLVLPYVCGINTVYSTCTASRSNDLETYFCRYIVA